MRRLAVLVEGQTEAEFVARVLRDHLWKHGVEATAVLVGAGRGGAVSSGRLVSDMVNLLGSFEVVTTLVDYYGFQRKGSTVVADLERNLLRELCDKWRGRLDLRRVIPYVQMHEFEGLLFSDVHAFATYFPHACVAELQAVRDGFRTPEDINDSRETAPSKRLDHVIPRYNKVFHGPQLAAKIGLSGIRAECPRFACWVERLESLGTQ